MENRPVWRILLFVSLVMGVSACGDRSAPDPAQVQKQVDSLRAEIAAVKAKTDSVRLRTDSLRASLAVDSGSESR